MIEAVLGIHATDHEHSEARSGPTACSDDTGGVTLGRLLAIATLSPPQAALLVTDVVDQLELAHGRSCPPIRFRYHDVMVSDAGHLVIRSAGDAESWDEVRDAATSLLHRIVTNCRSEALADRLDVAIAESSDLVGLSRRVRYAAATEFDDSEIGRKRSQLAALVSAVKGRARTEDAAVEGTGAPIPTTPRPLESNRRHPFVGKVWHRKRRRLSRRRGILALLAVLALVGMVWAAPTAWSELSRAWSTLLNPVESSMDDRISPVSPPAEPGAEPSPVETALPGAAGPITQVAATFANGPCEPGQSCTVRVDVGLDPAASVGAVTWNPTVYDRCTGATLPGGEVTIPVPPGAREAYGIGSVDLPPGSALAVAAVTTVPVAAASEPVYVPSENATCSPGSPRDGG